MLLRLDDPALVDDLCAHYTRSGFTAEWVGGCMVEVRRPDAPSRAQAEREIALHLRVWEAMQPGASIASG